MLAGPHANRSATLPKFRCAEKLQVKRRHGARPGVVQSEQRCQRGFNTLSFFRLAPRGWRERQRLARQFQQTLSARHWVGYSAAALRRGRTCVA
jgi:hypothetical protein